MFGRAMADRHGVGIIVSIDYHGASYGIQTPRLLCKHLTAAEVHPVPAGLTLAHRLGPDATPARRFAATAVDDGAFQRLFEAYKPDSDAPDHLLHRQTRYAFAQAAETLNTFYTSADCVLLPSRWDGWGMTINEALRHGCEVGVSRTAGVAALVGLSHLVRADRARVRRLRARGARLHPGRGGVPPG